jgi:plastocyanin
MRFSGYTKALFVVSMLAATSSYGGEVGVVVVDKDGQPVSDVAVYATRTDGRQQIESRAGTAVMDQVGKQFVPHLLVVQTGTSVEFPNSDTVAHHVYSFSHPNKFTLPMYKGTAHPPVTFEHSGVVTLGCNIHDHMLGYILVVDSAAYTKTDENGSASLYLDDPEEFEIKIWSPRIRDGVELLTVVGPDPTVSFRLAKKLNPPHGEQSWQEY